MTTKLTKTDKQPIPAGIFSGIEAFWYKGEKWVIAHGTTYRFHEAPSTIQQQVWKAFMADKQSLAYIAKMGLTKHSEVFETWYRCVIGGLDNIPDLLNGKLNPDAYNNMCPDLHCPHRGSLCSRATGLKNFEVETIVALEKGETLEATANMLCISLEGMKSRMMKIREKLNAKNMADLMSKTAQLGI